MTRWEEWAANDPAGAGIDLAADALRDSGLSARELLDEGTDGWHLASCLDAVRGEILAAAESHLRELARRVGS